MIGREYYLYLIRMGATHHCLVQNGNHFPYIDRVRFVDLNNTVAVVGPQHGLAGGKQVLKGHSFFSPLCELVVSNL